MQATKHSFAFTVRFAVLIGLLFGGVTRQSLADNWRYEPSDERRPVSRSIALSETRVPDIDEEVAYSGTNQRYAQLRYGSENSRRVTIVVDKLAEGLADVYVDLDRDRIITSAERISGEGRTRTFDLSTEIIESDEPQQATRHVQLRLSATGTRLSVATLGFIEGSVEWPIQSAAESSATESPATENAGHEQSRTQRHVRRIDGNANGLFTDSQDRLLIDLDQNGDWDLVTEQFAYLPVFKTDAGRFAVHSDRMGKRFSLSPVTGMGNLRIVLDALPDDAKIVTFEAMIFSDDGSAYSAKALDEPLELPVGKYTLGSVTMTIDNGQSQPWHFVFSRYGDIEDKHWTPVTANTDSSIEAVGITRFELTVNAKSEFHVGDRITVNPAFYTHDDLRINLSSRGNNIGSFDQSRSHNCCQITLETSDGTELNVVTSGFA